MASKNKIDSVYDFTSKGLRELEVWLEPWLKGALKGETGVGVGALEWEDVGGPGGLSPMRYQLLTGGGTLAISGPIEPHRLLLPTMPVDSFMSNVGTDTLAFKEPGVYSVAAEFSAYLGVPDGTPYNCQLSLAGQRFEQNGKAVGGAGSYVDGIWITISAIAPAIVDAQLYFQVAAGTGTWSLASGIVMQLSNLTATP